MNNKTLYKADLNISAFSEMSEFKQKKQLTEAILSNPEMAGMLIRLIIKVAVWALNHWIDKKTGRAKVPFWVSIAALLGSKTAKELTEIGTEAIEVAANLK